MPTIKLPQLAWFSPRDLSLELPADWLIETLFMSGGNRTALDPADIARALQYPIDSPSLKDLARGRREVVIVFDDLTRVTRTANIVPHVLRALGEAGIGDNNIRFICGSGLHGILNRTDFAKKLGEDVVRRFRVFNHNPFGNCSLVGTTRTFQTKVYLNEEYLKCDLKIAIGSCVPHVMASFGGGSKLVMPGIASFETVNYHHLTGGARMDPNVSTPQSAAANDPADANPFKRDIDEAAGLAGIDFLINTTVNLWGDSVAIFAGNWRSAYRQAAADAVNNYRTVIRKEYDLVIANSYAKASESMISLAMAIPLVDQRSGDIVIIANAPEGQATHYLVGIFGKTTFACQYSQCEIPANVNKVTVFNQYPHPGSSWFKEHPKINYSADWNDVVRDLRTHHGPGTRVAVIPDATNTFLVNGRTDQSHNDR